MKLLLKFHNWHQTKDGLLLFGLIELALAYVFGSMAIDRGNLWQYALCFVFFGGGLYNWYKALRLKYGKRDQRGQ